MKPWYTSKMVIIGILQLAYAISTFGMEFFKEEPSYDNPVTWITLANGIITIVLRWYTDKPITSPVKTMDKLRPKVTKNNAN